MSHEFFTPPQPSPRVRGGSKKFTNDLGLLYTYKVPLRRMEKRKDMQFTFKFPPINKLLPIGLAIVTVLLIAYFGQPRAIAQVRSNVAVDFGQPATGTISMSGILHGIDTAKPPDSSI